MVTRKKPERKEPLPEEIPSGEKITTSSVQKRQELHQFLKTRQNPGDTEVAITEEKRKCSPCRAHPVGRPEFGPLEEPIAPLPSLTALENAHLHAIDQLSFAKM
jgi:hypothetical protein